ncbi:MAG TPA: hypothetical protein VKA76_08860 [Gammaproteobacteria bacterium]|nr:hypothetical protein [Gammaproteobacteria bacterium]
MAHLTLDAVCTGMVLEADVTNSGGHTLLKAGTELSARHLTLLRAHGIAVVSIGPNVPGNGVAAPPGGPGDCCLAERFRHNDTAHPLIGELIRLCEARQAASTMAAGK